MDFFTLSGQDNVYSAEADQMLSEFFFSQKSSSLVLPEAQLKDSNTRLF